MKLILTLGMAYALMSGVPAINGIYVSFFQMIVYLFTGTSKHISVGKYSIYFCNYSFSCKLIKHCELFKGTFAITSLMTISTVKKYEGILYGPAQADPNAVHYLDNDIVQAKIKITTALTFGVGIIHLLLSILHAGVVTKYLSDSIVNGFTCGAAYQIVTSQIPNLLGISIGDIHIPFVIIGVFKSNFIIFLDKGNCCEASFNFQHFYQVSNHPFL